MNQTEASPQPPRGPGIRAVEPSDYVNWRPLWDRYNAFYSREGPTALEESVTAPLVAELDTRLVGLAHYLFHPSTSRARDVCYLQDLYTDPALRGTGIGRALIGAVRTAALKDGASRLYWQTQQNNSAARLLYDQVAQFGGFIVYTTEL